MARGLIEQHGGQLGYESAPGRGTVATIELPWCSRKMCKSLPNPLRPQEKVASGAAVSSADVTRAETAEATAR